MTFSLAKSLEMFLSDIIKKSAALAKEKDSAKLLPLHL